jgi:hypothetical protein
VADDAFLCQGCDASMHSANLLAWQQECLCLRPTMSPPDPPHSTLEAAGVAASTLTRKKRQ